MTLLKETQKLPTTTVTATTAAAAAIVSTTETTATATAFGLVFSDLYSELPSFKAATIKRLDSRLGIAVGRELYESKTPALPGFAIHDHFCGTYCSISLEHFL